MTEFLSKYCVQGTLSLWGEGTCVPDLSGSLYAREHIYEWGVLFIDAGVRTITVVDAYRTLGKEEEASGGFGPSLRGREALLDLMKRWENYARLKPGGARELSFLLNLLPFDWYQVDTQSILDGSTSSWPLFVHA